MRFCPSCGTALEPSWQFCGACGTPLAPVVSTPASLGGETPSIDQRPKRRWVVVGIVGAVLLLAVAGIGVLMADDDDDDGGALEDACNVTSDALPKPLDEGVEQLAGLQDLDDRLDAEGGDPTGDFARVVIAANAYQVGAIDDDTMRSALARFGATCEAAGYSLTGLDAAPPESSTSSQAVPTTPGTSEITETTAVPSGEVLASIEDCPPAPDPPLSVEPTAQCLYLAYKVNDRELARFYASDEAISSIFEYPWQPPDWEWVGCTDVDTLVPNCSYFIRDDFHGVGVELEMTNTASLGPQVAKVTFLG
jgi:hypothetical protein